MMRLPSQGRFSDEEYQHLYALADAVRKPLTAPQAIVMKRKGQSSGAPAS